MLALFNSQHSVRNIGSKIIGDELYVSVDVETSGPVPGIYSLLSIGACVVSEPAQSIYLELQPDGLQHDPETVAVNWYWPLSQRPAPPLSIAIQNHLISLFPDYIRDTTITACSPVLTPVLKISSALRFGSENGKISGFPRQPSYPVAWEQREHGRMTRRYFNAVMTDADPGLPTLEHLSRWKWELAREGKAVYGSLDHIGQAPLSHLNSGLSSPLPYSHLHFCPW